MSDAELLAAALVGLELQRSQIVMKMEELRRRLGGRTGRPGPKSAGVTSSRQQIQRKKTMSAAGRKRIAAAQRKRWAELKKAQAEKSPSIRKRKLSVAGKKRIIAATKTRWTEFRKKKNAGQKTAA